MAQLHFLKIDGIAGSSDNPRHRGEIALDAYFWDHRATSRVRSERERPFAAHLFLPLGSDSGCLLQRAASYSRFGTMTLSTFASVGDNELPVAVVRLVDVEFIDGKMERDRTKYRVFIELEYALAHEQIYGFPREVGMSYIAHPPDLMLYFAGMLSSQPWDLRVLGM